MEEQKRRQVSLLGPVLLVGVGTVLLLNTLGILEWSIWWTILRLWPVLLIAAGLDLLLGRYSIWGSLLAVVLVIAVLAGALWLNATGFGAGGVTAQEIRQPLGGATEAEVIVDPGVAVLRVEALPESANLVEGVIHLGKGEEVSQEYSQSGGKARFALRTQGGEPWVPFFAGPDERRAWELGLSPGATLQLRTSLGFGDARLDLTGLTLSELRTNMGLGLIEVTLPGEGEYQAGIDGAIGVTTIVIPEGLAARIHVDSGLTTRELPGGYEEHGDNLYVSPGYDTARDRVDLRVNQPIGVLKIRHGE
jgi:hypothetical protein